MHLLWLQINITKWRKNQAEIFYVFFGSEKVYTSRDCLKIKNKKKVYSLTLLLVTRTLPSWTSVSFPLFLSHSVEAFAALIGQIRQSIKLTSRKLTHTHQNQLFVACVIKHNTFVESSEESGLTCEYGQRVRKSMATYVTLTVFPVYISNSKLCWWLLILLRGI